MDYLCEKCTNPDYVYARDMIMHHQARLSTDWMVNMFETIVHEELALKRFLQAHPMASIYSKGISLSGKWIVWLDERHTQFKPNMDYLSHHAPPNLVVLVYERDVIFL